MVLITLQWSTQELRARRRESTNGTTLIHNLKKKKKTVGLKLLLERTIYIRIVLLWSGHQSLTIYTVGIHVRMVNTTRYIYFLSSIWFDFGGYVFAISNEAQKQNNFFCVRTCILIVRFRGWGRKRLGEIYKVTLEMSYLRKYAKICFSEVNIIILFTEWNHILVRNI